VRNLGVIFEAALNMEQQLNNICTNGYQEGSNIRHIRRYLTSDVIKWHANGLITPLLDYCNAFPNGLLQTYI